MIVDDSDEAIAMLRVLVRVKRLGRVVAEARSSEEANRLAAELQPDVIVLDLGLPDASDRRAFEGLRAAAPSARIVVFSAHDSRQGWYVERGVPFVAKTADGPENLASVLSAP
jgi:DNA-binding NarL/FixJ family response regulator